MSTGSCSAVQCCASYVSYTVLIVAGDDFVYDGELFFGLVELGWVGKGSLMGFGTFSY